MAENAARALGSAMAMVHVEANDKSRWTVSGRCFLWENVTIHISDDFLKLENPVDDQGTVDMIHSVPPERFLRCNSRFFNM